MGKDAGAPMILEDEQKTCEYPVHPLIPSRRRVLAFASTSVEPETLASWMEAASGIPGFSRGGSKSSPRVFDSSRVLARRGRGRGCWKPWQLGRAFREITQEDSTPREQSR